MTAKHVLLIVENNDIPTDPRVWKEALALKDCGLRVSIICPRKNKSSPSFETREGVDIYRHHMLLDAEGALAYGLEFAHALFWELLLSIRVYLKNRFDFIHAANPPDLIFLIASLYKLLGVKFIFDHHDLCPELYFAGAHRKDFFYRLLMLFEKLSFKTADMVISTNESYKAIAVKRGRRKAETVFVVRNGPEISQTAGIRPRYEYKEDFRYLIAYVGMIGFQERIDILLNMARRIVYEKGRTDIKFVVIGRGQVLKEMMFLRKQFGLEKYVEFTGYIPSPDFYGVLAAADICINPEVKNDYTDKSTMIKIMDYMALGKPIIQFNTVEGKRSAGKAAVNIPDNDETAFAENILALLDDEAARKKMGASGEHRIRNELSWDRQKLILRDAYEFLEDRKFAPYPQLQLTTPNPSLRFLEDDPEP